MYKDRISQRVSLDQQHQFERGINRLDFAAAIGKTILELRMNPEAIIEINVELEHFGEATKTYKAPRGYLLAVRQPDDCFEVTNVILDPELPSTARLFQSSVPKHQAQLDRPFLFLADKLEIDEYDSRALPDLGEVFAYSSGLHGQLCCRITANSHVALLPRSGSVRLASRSNCQLGLFAKAKCD